MCAPPGCDLGAQHTATPQENGQTVGQTVTSRLALKMALDTAQCLVLLWCFRPTASIVILATGQYTAAMVHKNGVCGMGYSAASRLAPILQGACRGRKINDKQLS